MREPVRIGDATLYLGNCLEIMPLLAPVDAVVTDPPYEKRLHEAKWRGCENLRKDAGPLLKQIGFKAIDDIRRPFIKQIFCTGWAIIFCTVEGVAKWADAINESPLKYKRACAWIKPDATPQLNGQGPAQGFECFTTAWCGQGHAVWNSGGKRGVYTHLVNGGTRHGEHPTEKPVSLMLEILQDFTSLDTTILDPFMGSGTTGVACAKLGRKFIGIEIDETYFDIACKRIEEAYAQPDLFIAPPSAPKQEAFL